MESQLINQDSYLVSLSECKRFVIDCMIAVGTFQEHAEALADMLSEADYRGHYSHGINRLDIYVNEVRSGTCDGRVEPKVLKETVTTAYVDGQNGLGVVTGKFCMDLAIKKANETGVGWVVAKGSNHFGIAGLYSTQALKHGLIGMSFTNSSPAMVPTRAKEAALGTNPISVAAPAKTGDSFLLDMATTTVALGKVEMKARENKMLPESWALNEDGQTELDPRKILKGHRLTPLGGDEAGSGYKGFGLGMLVEIFCSILSGGNYGTNIRTWATYDKTPANLSHCFVALDPSCFADGFEERLDDLIHYLRNMEPVNPEKPVLIPGDPEKSHIRTVDEMGGITYIKDIMQSCQKLAEELKVKPLVFS